MDDKAWAEIARIEQQVAEQKRIDKYLKQAVANAPPCGSTCVMCRWFEDNYIINNKANPQYSYCKYRHTAVEITAASCSAFHCRKGRKSRLVTRDCKACAYREQAD